MPSETEREQAIERVRRWVQNGCRGAFETGDVYALLAERDRLKAELARLTTLQDASEHGGDYFAVVWRREGDEWYPARIDLPKRGEMWTPLPTPRVKEADHEPQE